MRKGFSGYKSSAIKMSTYSLLLASCMSFGVFLGTLPALAAASTNEQSNKYFAEALEEYEQGNASEAIIQLRNAIQQDPSNLKARLLLGKMYLQAGNLDSAIKELEIVHESLPSDESELSLGRAYFAIGRYDDALEIVSRDALTSEMVLEKQIVRGDALIATQKYEQAKQAFEKALEIEPKNNTALHGLARSYALEKNIDQATKIMEEILASDPKFVPGWMLKGEVALFKGNKNEAFEAFSKAIELDPDDVSAHIARARAYLTAGELDKALLDTETIARLAPQSPVTKYLSASIHYAKGDLSAAAADYTQITEVYRDYSPAVLLGALINFKQGNLNQSENLLVRYLRIQPESAEAKRILAVVRMRNGDVRGSIQTLSRLVDSNPEDIASLQMLAGAYLQDRDFDNASKTYQKIVETGNPTFIRQADTALKLLSEDPGLMDAMGENATLGRRVLVVLNYINSDQLDDAREVITELKAEHPENPFVNNLEGSLLFAEKDYKQARTVFDATLEIDPTFVSAIDNLDRIDYIEGTPENIETRLDSLLTKAPNSEALIIRKAQFLSNSNRLEEATQFLNDKKDAVENKDVIMRALVRVYFALNRPEMAGQAADELAKASGDPAQLFFATQALVDAGMPAKAVTAAEKLLATDAGEPEAYMVLARAHIANQNVDKAKETLNRAFSENPGNAVIARGLVDIALGTDDKETAFSVIDQFAASEPEQALQLKANTLLKTGEEEKAIQLLQDRLATNPTEDVAIDLFIANRSAGNINEALAGLEAWIAENPNSRRALTAYAGTLLDLKKLVPAGDMYSKLLGLDPNNVVALNNYAWIRNELGHADALDYAERAYRIAPSSPEVADTFGWLMVKNGKLKDGLDVLRAAAGASPNNPDILYHLAYTLAKTGQNEDAIKILKVLLDKAGNFASRNEAMELYGSLT